MPKPLSYSERARLRLSRTPDFYRRFVADLRRSGLTAAAYCRKHHVATGTVRKYLRGPELRAPHPNRLPSAIPLPSPLPQLVPVRTAPDAPADSAFALEVVLPGGARLRFSEWDDRILAALGNLLGGAA